MEAYLEYETDKSDSLQRFTDKVKRITQLTELTPEIVHEFIEKIVISKPKYLDGKRHQCLNSLQWCGQCQRAVTGRDGRTIPRAFTE